MLRAIGSTERSVMPTSGKECFAMDMKVKLHMMRHTVSDAAKGKSRVMAQVRSALASMEAKRMELNELRYWPWTEIQFQLSLRWKNVFMGSGASALCSAMNASHLSYSSCIRVELPPFSMLAFTDSFMKAS